MCMTDAHLVACGVARSAWGSPPESSPPKQLGTRLTSGFMLSMLCAHAAITAGVAPAQTTAFQLLKPLERAQWDVGCGTGVGGGACGPVMW